MPSMTGDRARSLADRLDGAVLLPGDPGYDPARTVWNAMVDNRPAVIVRCASVPDVCAAVRFAREHSLEIGVRSGGHSVVGHSVPDGGLMVDLSPMGGVRVDPGKRRARVQGGALLGALDGAAQRHGLATTAGNVSHTGVGGLTLGGGMGWLARQVGLSCDNVVSFELVTADGSVVRASDTENPDLYWGLRGGGGNFGIVTEFEFRLHSLGTRAVEVSLVHPIDDALPVLLGWRDLHAVAPRQATFTVSLGGDFAAIGYVWVGDDAEEARALLPALRALGRPVEERVAEMSYLDLQRSGDSERGHGARSYLKGHYLTTFDEEVAQEFLLRGAPEGRHELLPAASLQAHGGAIAEVPEDATAFGHRDTLFEYVCAASWTDPAEDEARMAAARRSAAALDPYASGVYVNVLSDEGAVGLRRAYPPAKLARLTALKDAYDPDNVFHLNQNIAPSGAR